MTVILKTMRIQFTSKNQDQGTILRFMTVDKPKKTIKMTLFLSIRQINSLKKIIKCL
jgi:hypothetical protein